MNKKSWLPICVALLVGYIAGVTVSRPVRAHSRTTAFQSPEQPTKEPVYFEGQRFELGMSKSDALARLAECCRLSGGNDSFFVEKKKSPFDIIGGAWFAGDKVSTLQANLNQFQDTESVKLGLLLLRTALEITHSKPQSVILATNIQEIHNGTIRTLSLTLDTGRSLVIDVNSGDPGGKFGPRDAVDVYELLR